MREYQQYNVIASSTNSGTLNASNSDNTLNSDFGSDTVSYAQATSGIIANLKRGTVLSPLYGTTTSQPKIMPLGDSITEGENTVNPVPGTYRTQLWNNFLADNLRIDFVGSESNGPNNLGDKDHEGHGGWTIDKINTLVANNLLQTYRPDVILLMIGTNNLGGDSVTTTYTKLSNIINQITDLSPDTQLLVAAIAPRDPVIKGEYLANKTEKFNALIPDLVDDKVTEGKKVTFVDVGGSVSVEDLVDGTHPNQIGYSKMGDTWYDALVERDTLVSIENIIGTDFKDRLIGDSDANTITGGDGRDTLTGGGNADTFVYQFLSDRGDKITDFNANDTLQISAAGFGGGLVAGVDLSTTDSLTGVFISSETLTPIGDSANFLYNTITGALSFDVDGIGSSSAQLLLTLSRAPALNASQFYIS